MLGDEGKSFLQLFSSMFIGGESKLHIGKKVRIMWEFGMC